MRKLLLSFVFFAAFFKGMAQISDFYCADWNSPVCGGFDAGIFDRWFVKASYDEDNIPEYVFFLPEDGRSWEYISENVAVMDGSRDGNTVATGMPFPDKITVSDVEITVYCGWNPLKGDNGDAYPGNFIQRFRFYQFRGDAKILGIGVSLDNYIFAVDTYSKLVFAYGGISETEEKFGRKVPCAYVPVEGISLCKTSFFYENDPIGFVTQSGKVVLYNEYKEAMIRTGGVDFLPGVKDKNRRMAVFSEDGAGCSPFLNKQNYEGVFFETVLCSR